jgi:hypothetical protein
VRRATGEAKSDRALLDGHSLPLISKNFVPVYLLLILRFKDLLALACSGLSPSLPL